MQLLSILAALFRTGFKLKTTAVEIQCLVSNLKVLNVTTQGVVVRLYIGNHQHGITHRALNC